MKNISYWSPRVIVILFILFMFSFSLDILSMEGTVLEKTGGFLIHNIPVFIVILLLVFAWKKQNIGGILFILAGIGFALFFGISAFFVISFPLILAGVLFLVDK